MPKADEGHDLTERELAKLEKRIAKLYGDAAKEMQSTIDEYFDSFAKRDEEMKSLIGSEVNGKEWTKEDYKKWRLNQIGRGKRLEALRDKIAERVTNANETAVAYVNDATPGIYSLNRNYTAYTIEQISPNADFTLWDEQTVKRLVKEQPDLMPNYPKAKALKRGIDLEYGKKQITASITSSILQGKSIKHIADDLQDRITTMSRASAIRTARTAITEAQNAGRMDSYKAAEGMGIKLKKQWLSTLDNRTRHAHAMLDGQTVDTDKPFKVDGYEIMYPGDGSAPGYLVYNCRCTTIAVLPDVDTSDAQRWSRDPETGERKLVSDMSYQEWAGWKEKQKNEETGNGSQEKARKVYGKADGQTYKAVSDGDEVQLYAKGKERNADGTWTDFIRQDLGSVQIPENNDPNMLVVTGLPDKTRFGQFDDTPNYILSDGRMALNKYAKNNETREQIRGAVENEIYILGGARKDGYFYRVIGSEKEIGYIKNGTVRKSVNHMTGEAEDGLSVWEIPKYGGGKIVELKGDVISIGSDGEPVLDISTIEYVGEMSETIKEIREKGIEEFKRKYHWSTAQIEQALRGGYKINR